MAGARLRLRKRARYLGCEQPEPGKYVYSPPFRHLNDTMTVEQGDMAFGLVFASMFVATMGGVIRGTTGFGGSLVMTPALTLIYDPKLVIPVVLLLETFAAAPMMRSAFRKAEFRVITPICLAAFLTVPFGGYLLLNMDPALLRQWIAWTVIAFSLLLLAKVRYTGPRNVSISTLVGSLSGILLGGTGIGGPPIILFLLSGTGPVDIARANLTLIVTALSMVGLAMLWFQDLLNLYSLMALLVLGPCFFLGTIMGIRLFRGTSEQRFRQFAPLLLISVSVIALIH